MKEYQSIIYILKKFETVNVSVLTIVTNVKTVKLQKEFASIT